MKRMFELAAAAAIALALASPAMATPYSQEFNESGVGPFDDLQLFALSPSTSASLTGFSDGSWSASPTGNTHWAEADGNATSNLNFFAGFDYVGLPVTFDLFAFLGGALVDGAQIVYDPANENPSIGYGISSITALHMADYNADKGAVPEPLTLSVVGAGLIGLGLMKKRQNKALAA